MKKPVLTLFLTDKMSLKKWDELGLLKREMAIYVALQEYFQIQIYSYGNVADFRYEQLYPGIRVLIIPYYTQNLTFKNAIHRFRALMALKESDLLKTNQIQGADVALSYATKYKIPLITRCGYLLSVFKKHNRHAPLDVKRAAELEKAVFSAATAGFTSSERDRLEVISTHGISPEKMVCIPNYVDQKVFFPTKNPREKGHLLFIGRLSAQKNLFALLDAYEISKEAKKLTIIGTGEMEAEIYAKAKALSKPVECIPALPNPELAPRLQTCSAYILPSLFEGLPKSLLEAMSCGCACIGTDVEGIREVIQHDHNGWLTSTNAQSLADGIDAVLSNPERVEKLGQAAYQTIFETFSLEKVVAKEVAVYEKLLGRTL